MSIASVDRVVIEMLEHGVQVRRKVFAGQPVPPNLIAAYEKAGAKKPVAAAKSAAK